MQEKQGQRFMSRVQEQAGPKMGVEHAQLDPVPKAELAASEGAQAWRGDLPKLDLPYTGKMHF